jgi:hypothetical protein
MDAVSLPRSPDRAANPSGKPPGAPTSDARKRGVLLFKALLIICILGPISYLWWMLPRPVATHAPISQESFDQIEEGMTEHQVDEILRGDGVEVQELAVKRWTDRARPDHWIRVYFTEDGQRVVLKEKHGF